MDDLAVEEVALDDLLQHFGSAGVIPRAFGVNDGDRALDADAQAIDFAAIDQRVRADELQLLEAVLQEFPAFAGLFARRAFRFGLIRAEENVAAIFFEAEGFGRFREFRVQVAQAMVMMFLMPLFLHKSRSRYPSSG